MRRVLVCCVTMAALALVPPSVQSRRCGAASDWPRRRVDETGPEEPTQEKTGLETGPEEEKKRGARQRGNVANVHWRAIPARALRLTRATSACPRRATSVRAAQTSRARRCSARTRGAGTRCTRAPPGRASPLCAASWRATRRTRCASPRAWPATAERSARFAPPRAAGFESPRRGLPRQRLRRRRGRRRVDLPIWMQAPTTGPGRRTRWPPLRRRHGGAAGLGQDAGGHRRARRRECVVAARSPSVVCCAPRKRPAPSTASCGALAGEAVYR